MASDDGGVLTEASHGPQDVNAEEAKDDVNVVIVPESVLQAIKNSSNQNETPQANVLYGADGKSVLNENVGLELDINQNDDNNLWVTLPMNASVLGQESAFQDINTDDCSSKLVNILIPASSFTHDVAEYVTAGEDLSYPQPEEGNVDLSAQQNCLYLPPTSLFLQPGESSSGGSCEHATSNSGFVTMRIENIENDGENSIYTLAPANATNEHTATKPESVCSNALNTDTAKPSVGLNVKLTADKGTHTDGARKSHKCNHDKCNRVFSSAKQLNRHKVTVHDKEKVYKCKYANCQWSFQTPYKLRRHLESHYKQKPFPCTYPGCEKVFSNSYNLTAHMKSHNELQPELICQHCGLVAPGKRKLELHLRKEHGEKPSLLCSICNQKFHTMSALVIHKRSHDPHKVQHQCPLCEKKFAKRCELKMHLYKHTGERPFQCDQCEWTFTNLSRLNRHQRTHREKRYNCKFDNCDKQFHRLDHLTSHLKMHSVNVNETEALKLLGSAVSSKDMQLFMCEGCGYNFLSRHGLGRHKVKCQHEQPSTKLMGKPVATKDKLNDRVLISQSASVDETNMIESSVSDKQLGQEVIDSLLSDAEESLHRSQDHFTDPTSVGNEVVIASQDVTIPSGINGDVESSQPSTICIIEPDSGIQGLDNSWSASLLSDDNEAMDTSQYLSQDQVASVPLAPFIDDMVSLTPSNAQQFLQLEGDMRICGDSVPNNAGAEATADQEPQDVLRQYVVAPNSLGGISEIQDSINIVNERFKSSVASVGNPTNNTFFDDSGVLTSMGDGAHGLTSTTHFSGTTINLNDLQ